MKEKRKPIAMFTNVSLGKKKPGSVYFYTVEEARKYLMRLPKDWVVEMLLNAGKIIRPNKIKISIENIITLLLKIVLLIAVIKYIF